MSNSPQLTGSVYITPLTAGNTITLVVFNNTTVQSVIATRTDAYLQLLQIS